MKIFLLEFKKSIAAITLVLIAFFIIGCGKVNAQQANLEPKRASERIITFISQCEGFVGQASQDNLCAGVTQIGYGHVINQGENFGVNITEQQARELLSRDLNERFAPPINNFLISNNIKFSQQQFDALISFSYNLGVGWINNSDLRNILLQSDINQSSGEMLARVNVNDYLNVRSGPSAGNSVVTTVNKGENVTVLELTTSSWYRVRTQRGIEGYASSQYINIINQKSLDAVNKDRLINEIAVYHHVTNPKRCILGLIYRRFDEISIFLHGDYTRHASPASARNYRIPECILNAFPKNTTAQNNTAKKIDVVKSSANSSMFTCLAYGVTHSTGITSVKFPIFTPSSPGYATWVDGVNIGNNTWAYTYFGTGQPGNYYIHPYAYNGQGEGVKLGEMSVNLKEGSIATDNVFTAKSSDDSGSFAVIAEGMYGGPISAIRMPHNKLCRGFGPTWPYAHLIGPNTWALTFSCDESGPYITDVYKYFAGNPNQPVKAGSVTFTKK